ncbi:DUF4268 domain-containing protein [Methylocaldum sp. 14B]|jgi:hypothetical protein|uniref:DUF4268 domain-containing protein n=1 Tax=Methylocaldum sp. 14B TaxID=1912213 RepID=UPI00098B643B|nr:DUF4268 domain-containing protein [Methylocaldum sp. 14B]
MTQHPIGKLQRVSLREVWKHEARDFTQWLQDNIDVLNDILDLNLVNVDREQSAGSFSVDLVAEDEGGGTVIIENQLEKSNHDHLGKLITYLTAMSARAAVWIVSEPRPEHVAAIAWLNESSSADFFLVKVEAVRIGESPAAPLLTVIVRPSQETKTVGHQKKELAERHDIRRAWWAQLVARSEAKLHAHITPGQYSWIGVSSGTRGLNLNYVVTQDECGAELYIDRGKDSDAENKRIFDQLYEAREEIEQALPEQLSWERMDGRRACRIRISIPGGYRSPDEDWEAIQTRLVAAMNGLDQALKPHLKKLRLGS